MNEEMSEEWTNEDTALCLPGAYGLEERCPYKHAPHVPNIVPDGLQNTN